MNRSNSTSDTLDQNLTVVVPTLNSAATLDWTLASLTKLPTVRVIVADSFSTDATLDVCRRWNVEVVYVPAGNMYKAINAGLRLAQTEWLGYVNSDDWVFSAAYGKMLDTARTNVADIVYGSADYVDLSGRFLFSIKPTAENVIVKLLRAGRMAFCQPAAIFRRTAFERLGGFDEQYKSAGDLDFYCRAAINNLAFKRFNLAPVAAFRLHKTQISSARPDWERRERTAILNSLRLHSTFEDKWAFFCWRIRNLPWYAARALRSYELSGTLNVQKSTVPPIHE